jgi:hypothetical protein
MTKINIDNNTEELSRHRNRMNGNVIIMDAVWRRAEHSTLLAALHNHTRL